MSKEDYFHFILCPLCHRSVGSQNSEVDAIAGLVRHAFSQHDITKKEWIWIWNSIQDNRELKKEIKKGSKTQQLFSFLENNTQR